MKTSFFNTKSENCSSFIRTVKENYMSSVEKIGNRMNLEPTSYTTSITPPTTSITPQTPFNLSYTVLNKTRVHHDPLQQQTQLARDT